MESRPKKLLDQVRDAIRVKHYAHPAPGYAGLFPNPDPGRTFCFFRVIS
jgi:hypothetical protein